MKPNIVDKLRLLFDRKAMAEAYASRFARTRFVLDKKKIEHAFTCENKKTKEIRTFYRFKDIMDMPPLRYSNWYARMNELSMGVDREYLLNLRDLMVENLSGSKGTINLQQAGTYIDDLYARLMLAPNEDQIYYAASIEYFDLDEDLTDYNFNYNNDKIRFWKESHESLAFFLRKPVRELLGWEKTSKQAIQAHLTKAKLQIESSRLLIPSLSKGTRQSKKTPDTSKS